jgi:hypothetical protein
MAAKGWGILRIKVVERARERGFVVAVLTWGLRVVANLDRRLFKPACFASIIYPPGRTKSWAENKIISRQMNAIVLLCELKLNNSVILYCLQRFVLDHLQPEVEAEEEGLIMVWSNCHRPGSFSSSCICIMSIVAWLKESKEKQVRSKQNHITVSLGDAPSAEQNFG